MPKEIRELAYFAEVIERASITRAADAIGISQPALTKCMRQIEERLGVQLLERGNSGVRPTMCGDALYARAKSILAEITRTKADIDELSGKTAGAVTIGVLPSQATNLLPLAAVRLADAAPGVRLRVFEKSRGDLLSSLRRGEFDLVISVLEDPAAISDLTQIPLVQDRPAAIVRRHHPVTKSENAGLRELSAYPWLMPPAEAARRGSIERICRKLGIVPPTAAIECRSVPFMKAVVAQSNYVGFLPNDAPTPEEDAGVIVRVQFTNLQTDRTVGIIHRSDYPLSAIAQSLIRELRRIARTCGQSHA